MGFNFSRASGGGSASISVEGEKGALYYNNGKFFARAPTYVAPLYIDNADGQTDQQHFRVKNAGWQPSAEGEIDATIAGTDVFMFPFRGADEFNVLSVEASDFNGALDSAFRFEVWTGPAKTGTNWVPSQKPTKQYDYETQEFLTALPWKGRPKALYVSITVANTVNRKFWLRAYARITEPLVAA